MSESKKKGQLKYYKMVLHTIKHFLSKRYTLRLLPSSGINNSWIKNLLIYIWLNIMYKKWCKNCVKTIYRIKNIQLLRIIKERLVTYVPLGP